MKPAVALVVTDQERRIILEALGKLTAEQSDRASAFELHSPVSALIDKLLAASLASAITIGIYGGQVQWVAGNSSPVRICDYDGEVNDLPNVDQDGQPCRVWYG